MASQDASSPPGRLKLLLKSQDEVRKVQVALQGQTIRVGQDLVGITVSNDMSDAVAAPGNGQRR